MENTQKKRRDYLLPVSILAAAVLVSGALVYNAGRNAGPDGSLTGTVAGGVIDNQPENPALNVSPVTQNDHIKGNPNAPITIIGFSDFECPYCKTFHEVINEVMIEYSDKVMWVFRQLPLDSLHSKARKEAEASECAAGLGGNDAFWDYVDELFSTTPSNNGLNLALLPQIAENIGLDKTAFIHCLENEEYANAVEEDIQDAMNSGSKGTPYSIIITANGDHIPLNGYLPYEQFKLFIDELLTSL